MTITPATHAISINPATGEQLSVLPWAGANDIENALQLAAAGFRDWRETNIDYRAEKLRDIGKALRARSEEMAQMITREIRAFIPFKISLSLSSGHERASVLPGERRASHRTTCGGFCR